MTTTTLTAAQSGNHDDAGYGLAYAAAAGPRERDFLIQIGSEYEYVEWRGNQFARPWQVIRGFLGTAPANHAQGATVTVEPTIGAGGAGGVNVDNGTDPPAAVTTLVAPGADVSVPGQATILVFRRLGPFHFAWNTPDFMAPATTNGPVAFVVPAGSLFMVWGFMTANFNLIGRVVVGLTNDPTGQSNFLQIASYIGTANAEVDLPNAFTESSRTANPDSAQTVDSSLPRWSLCLDERSVVVAYQPDAANATTGAIDIYAIIATQAS